MHIPTRRLAAPMIISALAVAACGASDDATSNATDVTVVETNDSSTTDPADSVDSTDSTTDSGESTVTDALAVDDGDNSATVASMFADGALTADAAVVDCTLENGSETTCYQVEVASLSDMVATDGPYCPDTADDEGGIWVWDGDEPGLYALDADFWAMMDEQGFDFVDADGNITVTDPGAGGGSDSGGTANSCLEATADGSFHLQVLLPTDPELLDTPVDLGEISQVGLALDGVTIFGDAPSVADRGGLPALDACGGHIDPSGYYHWHFGAESIQTNLDDAGVTCDVEQDPEALIGFSYDGYAIYGPEEDREIPSDLDECSGHVSDTDEFDETYHYHLTYDSPNLPACRVGASAVGALSSPDNDAVALPGGSGPGGDGAGPPPGEG